MKKTEPTTDNNDEITESPIEMVGAKPYYDEKVAKAVDFIVQQLKQFGMDAPAEVLNAVKRDKKMGRCSFNSNLMLLHVETAVQPLELRLRRLLAYGFEVPLYQCGVSTKSFDHHYSSVIVQCVLVADQNSPPRPVPKTTGLKNKSPREWPKKSEEELSIERMKRDSRARELYPLLSILEEFLDPNNGWKLRECAIFALAVCAQVDSHPLLKNGFYRLAEKYLESERDFFFFLKVYTIRFGQPRVKLINHKEDANENDCTSQTKKRNRCSWGHGIRSLVLRWYKKQNPKVLLKSYSFKKSHFGWKHTDVLNMAHLYHTIFKDEDTSIAVVMQYILKGYSKTMERYSFIDELKPLLDVMEENHLAEEPDPSTQVKLIHALELKVEQVKPPWLNETTWPALVANMTVAEVLHHMPRLWLADLDDNTQVWEAAAKVLKTASGSEVEPSAVAVAKMNYLMAISNDGKCTTTNSKGRLRKCKVPVAESESVEDISSDEEARKRKPNNVIIRALDELLEKTFKKITQRCDKRVLAAVHLGKYGLERCAYTHSMSAKYAAALMLFSLSLRFPNLHIVLFDDGMMVKELAFPETPSINYYLDILDSTPEFTSTETNPELSAPIHWAIDRFEEHKQFDAFVIITPSLNDLVRSKDVAHITALQNYHNLQAEKRAKLAVCVLATVMVKCAQPSLTQHSMGFAGFDQNTIFFLDKFICGELDNKNILSGRLRK